jgi:hypothetical protein
MIFPRTALTRALKTRCVEEIKADSREHGPGLVALRDTPVALQAGLRACERMKVYPDESPSHAI